MMVCGLYQRTDQGGKPVNFMEGKSSTVGSDGQYDEPFFKSVREGKEDIKNHKTAKVGSDYWGYIYLQIILISPLL